MDNYEFLAQKKIGLVLFVTVSISLCVNLLYFFIVPDRHLDSEFLDPSVIVLILTLPIVIPTMFFNLRFLRFLQTSIIYIFAMIAIYENYDSFWGWGLYIMALGLMYLFNLIQQNCRLKIILSYLFLVGIGSIGIWDKSNSVYKMVYSLTSILFFILLGNVAISVFVKMRGQFSENNKNSVNHGKMEKFTQYSNEKSGSIKPVVSRKRKILLTEREGKLLELFAKSNGRFTNKEIAECLGISEQSVKGIMHKIMRKFDVCSRAELLSKYCGENT